MSKKWEKAGPIKKLLLKNGTIIDPSAGMNEKTDMLIVGEKIEKIGAIEKDGFEGDVIDCSRILIVPGLMDIHVHLREPGREDKENIESGAEAAMSGGFTELCCMPNTHPPIDSRDHVEFIRKKAAELMVDIHPIPAVTKGLKGEELTEMGDMVEAGAVAFSDDGYPVKNAAILRRALEYLKMFSCPVIDHCEELTLTGKGVMNESAVSTSLGLRGIPSISEDIMVARDLLVAGYTGGRIHIAHVSTKGAVGLIRKAKKEGVRVTAETCPHYLVLTDEAVRSFDTNTKMKPPLRTDEDRKALIAGLQEGVIDAIATDHAPHTIDDKEVEFDAAAFGIVGLETAVGLMLTYLVQEKCLSIEQLIEKMSVNPRKILGMTAPVIQAGKPANLTLIDLKKKWKVDKSAFKSRSANTPFDGWELTGRAVGVIHRSRIFYPANV